jgi:metal-sulfur cluster biosynthetic enzyme
LAHVPQEAYAKSVVPQQSFIWLCNSIIIKNYRREEDLTELEDKVREAVGQVIDPETGLTFAEMQLIANVKEEESGLVKVDFIPSSPFCPIAFKLAMDVKNAASKVAGVNKVLVYCRGHMMEQQINESVNK